MPRRSLHGFIMREAAACGRMKPKEDLAVKEVSFLEHARNSVAAAYRDDGPTEAERLARLFQRNLGFDWQKLYEHAVSAALTLKGRRHDAPIDLSDPEEFGAEHA